MILVDKKQAEKIIEDYEREGIIPDGLDIRKNIHGEYVIFDRPPQWEGTVKKYYGYMIHKTILN